MTFSNNSITNIERAVKYQFNIVAIGREKKPLTSWKQFQQRVQTEQEREEQLALLRQGKAYTISLLNGVSNLVAIDVDAVDKAKPVSKTFLVELLQKVQLPENYAWAWRSVSGSGWHVWVIIQDLPENEKIRIVTNEKLNELGFENIDSIRAIEIRSRNSYTLIPPRVLLPESPPSAVSWKTISTVFALKEHYGTEHRATYKVKKRVTQRDRAYALAALRSAAKNIAKANVGERNKTLFYETRSIGRFVEANALDKETLIETISQASPLSERETMSTLNSALKHAKELGPRYAPERQQNQQKESKNKAAILVDLAKENAEFFHDDQHNTYAKVFVNGHKEVKPLRSKDFKLWLFRLLHEQNMNPPGSEVYTSAINTLESIALYDSPLSSVYLRVAPDGGNGLYVDLCNDDWQAVHVTPQGWHVVSEYPVHFVRKRGMLPLPTPVSGGSFDDFRRFGNIPDDESWSLVKAWLTASLVSEGPYPVLVLKGEQGCAKTTLAKMLRSLIDPANPELRRPPRDPEDLYIAASSCWVLALDNISYISDWLSDDLCSLATGGGHARRQLYTDDEEVLFSAQRPVILNGITDFIHRDDLLDRTVIVELQRIPEHLRRDEKTLWAEFEAHRPKLFGALLDRLAGALRERHHVKLSVLPRMADFALIAAAAEKYEVSDGWSEDTSLFLQSYREAREEAHEHAINASVVGVVLMEWLAKAILPWEDTPANLLKILNKIAEEQQLKTQGWPRTVNNFGSTLRRIAPALRAVGYNIEFLRTKNARIIRITKILDSPDSPSTPPEPGPEPTPPSGGNDTNEVVQSVQSNDNERRNAMNYTAAQNIVWLKTAQDVEQAMKDIMSQQTVGLDLETTGLNPREHRIRLVQLATPNAVYMLDAFKTDIHLLDTLFRAKENQGPVLAGHFLEFDLTFLRHAGIEISTGSRVFDTCIASKLLSAGLDDKKPRAEKISHSLQAVVQRYLNVTISKTEQKSDWSGELTQEQIQYAANDAAILLPLSDALSEALYEAELTTAASIEMRAIPAIVWMKDTGVYFDSNKWRDIYNRNSETLEKLSRELAEIAGKEINWNSHEQVRELLVARGIDVQDTQEKTLKPYAKQDVFVAKLLEYKKLSKRLSSFGLEFLKYVSPDSRIRFDLKQTGTSTGRMSCENPNVQQIPRDPEYRQCFTAPPGRILIKADYSQIELRIAAEIANDRRMLNAYENKEDLHELTARLVLGVNKVEKNDRQKAKALNFGLLYGMGATGLRNYAAANYGVEWTEEEAKEFRNRFFKAYQGLKRWHNKVWQNNNEKTTRTLSKRRRLNVESFTEKLNTPVQGTGADGLKAALGLMWDTRILRNTAVPILAVHDEIVVECDEEDAEKVKNWVVDCMVQGMKQFLKNVPVEVEAVITKTWGGK